MSSSAQEESGRLLFPRLRALLLAALCLGAWACASTNSASSPPSAARGEGEPAVVPASGNSGDNGGSGSPSIPAAPDTLDPQAAGRLRDYLEREAFYPPGFTAADEVQFEAALRLSLADDARGAARGLEELTARYPLFAPGHHRLGLCYAALGDQAAEEIAAYRSALAALDAPGAIDPADPGAGLRRELLRYRVNECLGDALLADGHAMEARSCYERALAFEEANSFPASPKILFNLGLLFAREYGEKEIEDHRRRAVALFTRFLKETEAAGHQRRADASLYLSLLEPAASKRE